MKTLNQLYSDISPTFARAWNNDVDKVNGLGAIVNSMLGIVLTRKGSRPFYPEFGCDISNELFENMDALTADNIKASICNALTDFEPRITVREDDITTDSDYDNNIISVIVKFKTRDEEEMYKLGYTMSSNGALMSGSGAAVQAKNITLTRA